MNYKYIAISGAIGAGKSELAKRLAGKLNANLFLEEFASNSFLEKFYKEPERYAFPLEISFLFERFQQQKLTFSKADMFKTLFMSDYIFDKSILFARNNLNDDQFKVFYNLYAAFEEQLPSPDLIVYLHRPVEVLLDNIKRRGRDFEQDISQEYLESIQNLYIQYYKNIYTKVVLILQMEDLDFLKDELLIDRVQDIMGQKYTKGYHIIQVNS